MSRYKVLALLVVVLLAFSGCGKVAEIAVEKATGIEVDQSGESVTIKGEDGESYSFDSDLPEQLKDLPIPSGFEYDSGSTMTSGDGYFAVATWNGKAGVDEVAEFYQERLPDQGWEETSTISGDGSTMLSYQNGEDSLTLTIEGEGETTISAMMGQSAEPTAEPEASTDEEDASVDEEETTEVVDAGDADTPEPPETTDASSLPDSLKEVPMPEGFAVVADSTLELTQGEDLQMAAAQLFGATEPKDVGEFYRESLPSRGWEEDQYMTFEGQVTGIFTNAEAEMILYVTVTEEDGGTFVYVQLGPAE